MLLLCVSSHLLVVYCDSIHYGAEAVLESPLLVTQALQQGHASILNSFTNHGPNTQMYESMEPPTFQTPSHPGCGKVYEWVYKTYPTTKMYEEPPMESPWYDF